MTNVGEMFLHAYKNARVRDEVFPDLARDKLGFECLGPRASRIVRLLPVPWTAIKPVCRVLTAVRAIAPERIMGSPSSESKVERNRQPTEQRVSLATA
jgi:hypothetical protein